MDTWTLREWGVQMVSVCRQCSLCVSGLEGHFNQTHCCVAGPSPRPNNLSDGRLMLHNSCTQTSLTRWLCTPTKLWRCKH